MGIRSVVVEAPGSLRCAERLVHHVRRALLKAPLRKPTRGESAGFEGCPLLRRTVAFARIASLAESAHRVNKVNLYGMSWPLGSFTSTHTPPFRAEAAAACTTANVRRPSSPVGKLHTARSAERPSDFARMASAKSA